MLRGTDSSDFLGLYREKVRICRVTGRTHRKHCAAAPHAHRAHYCSAPSANAARQCGILCLFSHLLGACPWASLQHSCITVSAMLRYDSCVTPAMCGVTTTRGSESKGSSRGTGSCHVTSKPRPPTMPCCSPCATASRSMRPPRATLMMRTACLRWTWHIVVAGQPMSHAWNLGAKQSCWRYTRGWMGSQA